MLTFSPPPPAPRSHWLLPLIPMIFSSLEVVVSIWSVSALGGLDLFLRVCPFTLVYLQRSLPAEDLGSASRFDVLQRGGTALSHCETAQ